MTTTLSICSELFFKFKEEYIQPIETLLLKYNVSCKLPCRYYDKSEDIGYYIRNGIIKITSEECSFLLGHELAHIILINNFDKLLVDNWGMPIIHSNHLSILKNKFLLNESRVWGVENFLYKDKYKREPNEFFIKLSINNWKSEVEFNKTKEKSLEIMNRYENQMTLDKFLNDLEIRLSFIKNHIDNNPGFNSKEFDMFKV